MKKPFPICVGINVAQGVRYFFNGLSHLNGTSGLVAMTSASHAEGRQFDPGLVYFDASSESETGVYFAICITYYHTNRIQHISGPRTVSFTI